MRIYHAITDQAIGYVDRCPKGSPLSELSLAFLEGVFINDGAIAGLVSSYTRLVLDELNRCDLCGDVQPASNLGDFKTWIECESDGTGVAEWKIELWVEDKLKDIGKSGADEACQECLERFFL